MGVTLAIFVSNATAEGLFIGASDTVSSVLETYKGKRVYVRLTQGEELSGKVVTVTPNLLHLGEIRGREYFDAAIDMYESFE